MKIYSVSTRHYFAFGALVSEELSLKLKDLPGVRWVLPDSYADAKNKDYGGEPFINGQAVPYDPKYHEEWLRQNAKAQERNRRNDRPRIAHRSRNFERRRPSRGFNPRPPVGPDMGGPGGNMGGQPSYQGGYAQNTRPPNNSGYALNMPPFNNVGYAQNVPPPNNPNNVGYAQNMPSPNNPGYALNMPPFNNVGYAQNVPPPNNPNNVGYAQNMPPPNNPGYALNMPPFNNVGYAQNIPPPNNPGYGLNMPPFNNVGHVPNYPGPGYAPNNAGNPQNMPPNNHGYPHFSYRNELRGGGPPPNYGDQGNLNYAGPNYQNGGGMPHQNTPMGNQNYAPYNNNMRGQPSGAYQPRSVHIENLYIY